MKRGLRLTKNKLFVVLFMLAYFSILGYSIFGHISSFGLILRNISALGYVVLMILIILQIKHFAPRDVMRMIPLLILSIIIAANTNNYSFLKLLLIISSARTINVRQYIKVDIIIRFIFLFIMLILFYTGLAPDNQSAVGNTIRHSMGFENCNQFGMYVFIIIAELVYLTKASFNFKTILTIVLLIVFEENTSGCRTVLVSTTILLTLSIIANFNNKVLQNKLIKSAIIIFPIVAAIATLVMAHYYSAGNELIHQIDDIASGRLRTVSSYLGAYTIKPFGNDIAEMKLTLDNLYAYSIIALGIIPTVTLIILYAKLQNSFYSKHEYLLVIILITFMIYGLSERLWLYPEYNAIILSIKEYIFANKKKERQIL